MEKKPEQFGTENCKKIERFHPANYGFAPTMILVPQFSSVLLEQTMPAHHLGHLNSSVLFGLTGVLLAVLALPLIGKKIAPNPWYGLRVEQTLSNAQVWYEANKVVGVDLLIAGVAILCSAAFTYIIQQRSSSFPVLAINATVSVVAVSASFVHSWWALQNIK